MLKTKVQKAKEYVNKLIKQGDFLVDDFTGMSEQGLVAWVEEHKRVDKDAYYNI